jgi:hypothetical protein
MPDATTGTTPDVPTQAGGILAQLLSQAAVRMGSMFDMAATRQNDGAAGYAEATRYDYLKNKDNISFAQGTGQRMVDESGAGRVRNLDNTAMPTSASKPA